jgi:DNA invertase Pin-like site-specific DNA recombinase
MDFGLPPTNGCNFSLRISYRSKVKAMARKKNTVHAVGYLRTSSATNVGADKDSEKRQRAAIAAFAKRAGYSVAEDDWFYDADVKGADPVTERPGFKAMLDRIAGNGVRTVLVEDASRFARDLIVQLTGHDYLRKLGVTLIAANAPDHFLEDTPTAVLIRQVLGAVAQFEKANLVAKLKGARDRKKATTGKCGGRYSMLERNPYVVREAKCLAEEKHRSLREIAEELQARGHQSKKGTPFGTLVVQRMLAVSWPELERGIASYEARKQAA